MNAIRLACYVCGIEYEHVCFPGGNIYVSKCRCPLTSKTPEGFADVRIRMQLACLAPPTAPPTEEELSGPIASGCPHALTPDS